MKLRSVAAAVLLAASALVFATLIKTDAVRGRAQARNADGRAVTVSSQAAKITHNDAKGFQGVFELGQASANATSPMISLRMAKPDELNVTDNKGTFAGPGVLRVTLNGVTTTYEGWIAVAVVSNRHLGEPGDPDAIEVNFRPNSATAPTYHFAGLVYEGDLEVSSLYSY